MKRWGCFDPSKTGGIGHGNGKYRRNAAGERVVSEIGQKRRTIAGACRRSSAEGYPL